MRYTILFLIAGTLLRGASFTTVRSGDVTDSSHTTGPWCSTASPCAIPGAGDTVVIANGHTLNLPAGATWTIGDSANLAVHALATAGTGGTGVFTMQTGSTLVLRGHVRQGNATWQIGNAPGGATVIFDHMTAGLAWYIGDASLQANARLVIRGASGSPSVLRRSETGAASGGFQGLTGSIQNGGRVDAQYVSFSGIGGGTVPAFSFRATNSAFLFRLDKVTLENCGYIINAGAALSGDSSVVLTNLKVLNPSGLSNRWLVFTASSKNTGTRLVRNAYIRNGSIRDGGSGTVSAGWVFENVFFDITPGNSIPPINLPGNVHVGTLKDVLTYFPNSVVGGFALNGGIDIDGLLIIEDTPYNGNGHPISGLNITSMVTRWAVEGKNGQLQGDVVQTGHSGNVAGQSITIRDGVVIQPPGTFYGAVVNHTATQAHNGTTVIYPSVVARNLTWRGGRNGSVSSGIGGEANTGRTGLFTAVRNNLVWSEAEGTQAYITDYLSSPASGVFAMAGRNAHWNIAGVSGVRYRYSDTNPAVYGATAGSDDIAINPRLADTGRNFLKWGQTINPAHATWAGIMAEMAKLADDSGHDPRYAIRNAIEWVRWGYVPQEPRLWTAADGSYYGGVDPSALRNGAGAAAVAQ